MVQGSDSWRLFFTGRALPRPRSEANLAGSRVLDSWLDAHDVQEGSPFLLDPFGRYDSALNRYFLLGMTTAPINTQKAVAYDLKNFLSFLWNGRGGRDWRDATPDDRAAYKYWRLVDPKGPRIDYTSWDREVATVSGFYQWAVRTRRTSANPFVYRESRSLDVRRGPRESPAEVSHQGPRCDVQWLPPQAYRTWRDVGVRGHTLDGLLDSSFRGRFASRNSAYTDLMIRTGLRLAEQTALSLFELPERLPGVLNARTWLPAAIAKGRAERAVYIPDSTLMDIGDYMRYERAEAIEDARARGTYDRIRDLLVVQDRTKPYVMVDTHRIKVAQLTPAERLRLFLDTENGLEPAALWVNEDGLPSRPSAWQQVFKDANSRCGRAGLPVRCHPHMLRHSFAVITLEQLWRGHITDLGTMNPAQRQTYQMVFGDPVNWVRIRLGHRSIRTTQIYLHTLHELEMETRMALVPDEWEPQTVTQVVLEAVASETASA